MSIKTFHATIGREPVSRHNVNRFLFDMLVQLAAAPTSMQENSSAP
jgi:hypothetical protein